jgi:hypothetical protein
MTVVLSDMTLTSLLNIYKIPYDSSETYENKINILKNADILPKEEKYSNNKQLSQNQVLTNKVMGNDFQALLLFWNVLLLTGLQIFLPSSKYQDGLKIECKCKTETKKDYDSNETILIYQTQSYNISGVEKVVFQINHNINGNYSSTGQDGTSYNGRWFFSEDGSLNTEAQGYSDYYGKNIWMKTNVVKTPNGNYYSQNYYKIKIDDEYKITSVGLAGILFA